MGLVSKGISISQNVATINTERDLENVTLRMNRIRAGQVEAVNKIKTTINGTDYTKKTLFSFKYGDLLDERLDEAYKR